MVLSLVVDRLCSTAAAVTAAAGDDLWHMALLHADLVVLDIAVAVAGGGGGKGGVAHD